MSLRVHFSRSCSIFNQHTIAAGLEEVALWIEARRPLDIYDNITAILERLDVNADAITTAIKSFAKPLVMQHKGKTSLQKKDRG